MNATPVPAGGSPRATGGRAGARRRAAVLLGAVLAVTIGAAKVAQAQPMLALDEKLGVVRGWDIGINTSINGCLASAVYKDETTIYMGFSEGMKAFFALSNPRWQSIEGGRTYKLKLLARGAGNWRGDFAGIDESGRKLLIASDLSTEFVTDIARAGGVNVLYQDKSIARLSLDGSMAALSAVLECQKTLAARGPSSGAKAQAKGGGDGGRKKDELSTGTGFFVSRTGHILTNHHVVEGCKSVQVTRIGATQEPARVLAQDQTNDLALLKVNDPPETVPTFAPRARIGENIYVFGFPLAGLLATSGNFTVGNVTATAGLNDDSRMVQISAPVQPGNSGGPLLDQSGKVVGVVVSKLNALRLAAVTNDVAQNVNFAIKSGVALNFLDTNGVIPPESSPEPPLDPASIAERARAFTVYIECR